MEKILIFRIGSLGDGIVSLPAVSLLKSKYKNYEFYMLTNVPIASSGKAISMGGLFCDLGLIDKVISYEIAQGGFKTLRMIRDIRKEKFSKFVYLMPVRSWIQVVRDYVFFSLIAGLKFTVSFRNLLVFQKNMKDEHEASRLVRLAALKNEQINLSDLINIQSKLNFGGCITGDKKKNIICFSIGTKAWVKDWEDKKWIELISRLSMEYKNYKLVSIGVGSEKMRSENILKYWDGQKDNFCGQLSVMDSYEIIKSSALYIGHDSGPMHMAALAGVPMVIIFSAAGTPGKWTPISNSAHVIKTDISCAGCNKTESCEFDKKCMRDITVDQVYAATRSFLSDLSPCAAVEC